MFEVGGGGRGAAGVLEGLPDPVGVLAVSGVVEYGVDRGADVVGGGLGEAQAGDGESRPVSLPVPRRAALQHREVPGIDVGLDSHLVA